MFIRMGHFLRKPLLFVLSFMLMTLALPGMSFSALERAGETHHPSKNRVGEFFDDSTIRVGENDTFVQYPRWENPIGGTTTASGAFYEGFRYRDLETGTFITRDPLGFVDGPNVYTYVVQNPWTSFDPLGLWETGSYWGDVGQMWVGYGRSVKTTFVGIGTMVAHPIQTGKGIATAVRHPIQTGKAVVNDYKEKSQTMAGKGEIVGEVLIGLATGGGVKAADKAGDASRLARIANKVDDVADIGGDSARITQKVAKETAEAATDARALKNARQRGVNRAKSAERDLVQSGHPGTADEAWSWAERKQIAETGQFPSDTQMHHINDVKRHPNLADNPDNVIPSRGGMSGHVKKYHPDGTQTGSTGQMLDRKKLKNDHLKGDYE